MRVYEANLLRKTVLNGATPNKSKNTLTDNSSAHDNKVSTASEQRTEKSYNNTPNPLQMNINAKLGQTQKLNEYEEVLAQIGKEGNAFGPNLANGSAKGKNGNQQAKNDSGNNEGERQVQSRIEIFSQTANKTSLHENTLGNFVFDCEMRQNGKSPLQVSFNELLVRTPLQMEGRLSEQQRNDYVPARTQTGSRFNERTTRISHNDPMIYNQQRSRLSLVNNSSKNSNYQFQNQIESSFAETKTPLYPGYDMTSSQFTGPQERNIDIYSNMARPQLGHSLGTKRYHEQGARLPIPKSNSDFNKTLKHHKLKTLADQMSTKNSPLQPNYNLTPQSQQQGRTTPYNRMHYLGNLFIESYQPAPLEGPNPKAHSTNLYHNPTNNTRAQKNFKNIAEQLKKNLKGISEKLLVFTSFSCRCDFISLDHRSKLTRVQ